ncbi:MAG: hypothetical protein IKB59_02895, partial [Alphaproteobacteria bacterium]|nr:hypothetical protein [Alphaproteobacteria bacterium]
DPSRWGPGGLYAVTGAMGSVFSTLSNGTQPSFQGTFQNCKQLKSVESVLFRGITGQPIPYMFADTFDNTALEEVPNGLFSGLSGEPVEGLFQATFRSSNVGNIQGNYLFAGIKGAPAEKLFMETFANTKLNGIPNGLFDTISGAPADYMFYHTFNNTNLASIPTGLFKNISGGPASHMFEGTFETTKISAIPVGLFDGINNERAPAPWMFAYTFGGTPITTIPTGLFANIYGAPAQSMFEGTFANTDITSIPNGLFDRIDGVPARSMFANTFAGTKITSIPYALFPYVVGTPAQAMYAGTFMNTPITYIPADLFAGIAGEPAPEMFKQTFDGCNKIAAQIPETLFFGINGDLQEESFYRTFHGAVSVDFRYDTLNFVPPKLFDQDKINPDSATASNNAMRDIFQDSNLRGIGISNFDGGLARCPDTYRRVKTGFDTWFNTKTRTTYIWNDALNGGVKRACVKCPEHSNQREADEYACECDLGYSKNGKWSGNEDNIPNRIISNADEYCDAVTYNVIYECGSGEGDNYTTHATYGKGTYTIWDNLTPEGEQHCVNERAGALIGWQIKNQGYDECSHYDCEKMYAP